MCVCRAENSLLLRCAAVAGLISLVLSGAPGMAQDADQKLTSSPAPLPSERAVQDGDPALQQIRVAAAGERWAEADGRLRDFLRQHPENAEALLLLGAILFHENKPKESLEAFTRGARAARPSARDLRTVALDYVLLNDYDDADRWITHAAKDDPNDPETWYDMGRIKYTENRFAEAIQGFDESLRLAPHSVKAENNLGLTYEGLNRPEEAVIAYRQALAWQAGSPQPSEQPLLNLGILLTNRNQLDEALGMLQQAAAIAPKDPKIHEALGKLHARRGELRDAQTELEQAVRAEPSNSGLRFQLGQVYRKLGLTERAAAELKLAAALEAQARR